MAAEMHIMRKNLREMVASIQDAGQKINENVSELNEVTDTVNQMCSDNSATSQQLAAGMQETAATTVTINENVSQIKGEAQNINAMAEEGAKNSETVMDRALQLRTKTVTASNKTMDIYNSVKEKAEKAIEGSKAVEKINELTGTIMEISSQTGLLALNASIEAARAGEAGKGFAVVADEIRVLAEQSKAAVAHIQEVTGNVTAAVENLANDAERLLEFVGNDVVESLGGFAEMANSYNSDAANVDSLVTDFSASSEQLLASINGVMDAISDVSKTATEGATGTTDIAEKVGNVVQEAEAIKQKAETTYHSAEKLQKNVERFIV